MATNRRQFLTTGAITAASLAGVIGSGQHASAQSQPVALKPAPAQPNSQVNTNKELAGKVAIITGAARNMGRGYAVALARNGADIVVHYHTERSRADAEETARLVRAQGRRAIIVPGDLSLSQVANVRRMFEEGIKAFGRVDIVINNAGQIVKKPLSEITEEEYDRLFGINAKGAFFVMQEAARRISDNGRIINIGTSLLASTIGNYSAYVGSKAALEDFTRALAREIPFNRGITVNVVAPGPVDTPFFREPESPEAIARIAQLAGRLGEVNDIVPIVEFLASARSQWVNAQTLFVNGGYVAR